MKKIVITGSESTGKSTLTAQLAAHFNTPYVEEYARRFIDQLDRPYVKEDLIDIAKGQLATEKKVSLLSPEILLCDTDLLTIKIWSEFKYGDCDPFIIEQFTQNVPDLYLLCEPDLPWKPDPQRENPEDREALFTLYIHHISMYRIPFRLIKGIDEEREIEARKAVHSWLAS